VFGQGLNKLALDVKKSSFNAPKFIQDIIFLDDNINHWQLTMIVNDREITININFDKDKDYLPEILLYINSPELYNITDTTNAANNGIQDMRLDNTRLICLGDYTNYLPGRDIDKLLYILNGIYEKLDNTLSGK
jgi:hypothetical protein